MSIKVITPVSPETLVYDNVFMLGIHIEQEPNSNSNSPDKYDVFVDYKIFALDVSGTRHFDRTTHSISVLDYLQAAQAKGGLGDNTMLDAFTAIEDVVSLLITDKGSIGDTKVVV